jgi:hypothetical protein
MLFTLKEIQDYKLRAADGDFGEIKTFLIDDFEWAVRYLVAQVGSRQVLLSVLALGAPDTNAHILPVNVTKDKIMNSPTFDFNQRVSRDVERCFSDYFDWPYYWEPDDVPNTLPGDLTAIPLIDMELDREQQEAQELIPETGISGTESTEANEHLRSTQVLFGQAIHAANDNRNAGKLVDMVTQDENWSILYLMVDTGGLLPGKKVLFAPSWVKQVDEVNSRIDIDLTQETIHNGPEFTSIEELGADVNGESGVSG